MPFTTLNSRARPALTAPPNKPAPPDWLRNDFSELPPDIIESIVALWNGESRAFSSGTTQKVISAFHRHILDLRERLRVQAEESSQLSRNRAESPSKKRSSDELEQINGHQEKRARLPEPSTPKASIGKSWQGPTFEGVSFTIPQRKKLSLLIASSKQQGLLVKGPSTGVTENEIPWSSIEHVICLPVPEKTQAQKTFVIFPKGVDGLSEGSSSPYETLSWTVPDTKAKGVPEDQPSQAQAIKAALEENQKVLEPNPKDFTSEIPPVGGKKGDKAYHIKAHKGSKDGFLFLLPTGILWAFKKPLIFFTFPTIDSISYTSVLQRTFNLVISARASADTEPVEYEFSMLDQLDFAGIDAYIKRNQLQDASLASERRAKTYNVNGKKADGSNSTAAESGTNAAEGEEGESELAKAEREANAQAAAAAAAAEEGVEDSDDEEEDENFDPESESDGGSPSGSDSEDEGGDDEEGSGRKSGKQHSSATQVSGENEHDFETSDEEVN